MYLYSALESVYPLFSIVGHPIQSILFESFNTDQKLFYQLTETKTKIQK